MIRFLEKKKNCNMEALKKLSLSIKYPDENTNASNQALIFVTAIFNYSKNRQKI
jgi:hypothetical protein